MSKKSILKDIALQRIKYLYRLSIEEARRERYIYASRYIELIIKYSHRARVKPPKYIRRGYCRKCRVPLVPGLTFRIRIRSESKGSRVVVTCLKCGWMRRYMIKTRGVGSRRE